MAESQLTIRVDRETLRQFRAECIRRGTTPTRQIAQYVQLQSEAWLGHPLRERGHDQMQMPTCVVEEETD